MNIHLQRHNHIQQKINSIADEEKLFIQQDLVASDADITYIENHLKLRLTASYQWFLKVYGAGGVNGVFIAGMGTFEHRYAVVEETLNFRVEHPKLSQEFVFLEYFSDDWVCLLDTGNHDTSFNDCAVVAYQVGEERWETGWTTFLDYIEERFFGCVSKHNTGADIA